MGRHLPNNSKAQLDYKFINKKWINFALNCEACFSFEWVSSIIESFQQSSPTSTQK